MRVIKRIITLSLIALSCNTYAKTESGDMKINAEVDAGCYMTVDSSVNFGIIHEFPPYNQESDWPTFPQDMNWYMQCSPGTVFTVQPFSTEQWQGMVKKPTGIKLTNQTNPDASYTLSALIMFGVTPEEFIPESTLHNVKNPFRVITADGTKQKLKAYMFLENIWRIEGYSPTPGYYTGSTVLTVEY